MKGIFKFNFLKKIFGRKILPSNDSVKKFPYAPFYDVFISKKTEDSKMAKEICDFLENNGLRCFISERELPSEGNTNYYQTIDKALECSTNMVVVCSRAEYLESEWVKHEWQTFSNELISSKKPGNIITIRGRDVQRENIPFTLRNLELIDWNDYKTCLLPYIVRRNRKDNKKQPYSEAFMLGMNIGKYALDNMKGYLGAQDINNMKNKLANWNLPMDIVDPLLQLGMGMDFLNSIIDIVEDRWGKIYANSTYLGTIYVFYALLKGSGDTTSWNEKFVQVSKKLGLPKQIFQRIGFVSANEMVEFRDAIMSALDNLDNSVKKCPCCNARIGLDYEECPTCGFALN